MSNQYEISCQDESLILKTGDKNIKYLCFPFCLLKRCVFAESSHQNLKIIN